MLYLIAVIIAAVFIFLSVILIRAARFTPKPQPVPSEKEITLNEEKIVSDMQEMLRCKTVSYHDASLVNQEEFKKFKNLLPKLYLGIHSCCERVLLDINGILYHWKGLKEGRPVVLMSHFDVVPAEESQWEKPALEGILENGEIWGRGTLDTKGTLCGILEAAEKLISEGFTPQHDIYFAFSGQEEINGTACPAMVDWFEKQGIHPAMVLDEGGAVVENIFPGVTKECALIGIAEKGLTNIEFHAKSSGGHASMPPVHTIAGELAQAAVDVENHPFPRQLTKPVKEMLDVLGRHSSFAYKLLFANLWCFEGLFDSVCRKTGGELNAMLRTTCAITKMQGGEAFNVIPPKASIGMNLRLIGSDTVESARAYLEQVIHNPKIEVTVFEGRNPSAESDTSCEEWTRLCQTVADTWKDSLVTPYLMMACSDSWHYCRITDRVYKFSAMKLSKEERAMIHGNNERIPVKTLLKIVEFYVRLIEKC